MAKKTDQPATEHDEARACEAFYAALMDRQHRFDRGFARSKELHQEMRRIFSQWQPPLGGGA